ncbi:MAG: serine hydrolase domain-containing protein [Vicingaceae bacterium]
MFKYLGISVLLLMTSNTLKSQVDTAEQLSHFIQQTLEVSEVIPSVSVALVNSKGILYHETFGYADIEKKVKAANQSSYYIASVTKTYNGLLAQILAAEHQLDLEAPILDYKPFKDFEKQAVFQGITIMDLLTHQSGIDNPYLTFRLAYSGDYNKAKILSLIENETVKNETGKQFLYTNFGYYLFDYLLQEELGKSWKELLKEKIFNPLGMENTTAFVSKVPKQKLALPHSGVIKGEVKVSLLQKSDEQMHAAGGLMSTTEDAAKYLSFYLNKGSGIYPEALVDATLEQQAEADHQYIRVFEGKAYASGWRIGEFEKQKVYYHFGGYTGYAAHYSFLPQKNLGLVVLVNSDMGLTAANLIAKYAYNLYLGNQREVRKAEKILSKKMPKLLAQERKAKRLHEEKLASRDWNLSLPTEKYVGTYYNENYGSVQLDYQANQFVVKAGKLSSVATAFPTENTMRVELVPGSGTVIGFDVESGEVVSLYHQREIFLKQ